MKPSKELHSHVKSKMEKILASHPPIVIDNIKLLKEKLGLQIDWEQEFINFYKK